MAQQSAIVIEKNIPLPDGRGGTRTITHAMKTMEVGDSFVVDNAKTRNGIASMGQRFSPRRFKTRAVGDGTFRVWRTA